MHQAHLLRRGTKLSLLQSSLCVQITAARTAIQLDGTSEALQWAGNNSTYFSQTFSIPPDVASGYCPRTQRGFVVAPGTRFPPGVVPTEIPGRARLRHTFLRSFRANPLIGKCLVWPSANVSARAARYRPLGLILGWRRSSRN